MQTALAVAFAFVGVELVAIAWIRYRYLSTGFWASVVQVVIGCAIVLAVGILIGSS